MYQVAYVDGEPAGFGKLRDSKPAACVSDAGSLEIQQMYLLEEFHRPGVGGELMRVLLDLARLRERDCGCLMA